MNEQIIPAQMAQSRLLFSSLQTKIKLCNQDFSYSKSKYVINPSQQYELIQHNQIISEVGLLLLQIS